MAVDMQAIRAGSLWSQPLAERTAWLGRGDFRVAYVYPDADYSTFRYRVYNTVQTLNALSDLVSATWFLLDEMRELQATVPVLDTLVICRCPYNHQLDALVSQALANGVDVIYDIDDLLFDPDQIPLMVHSLSIEENEGSWDWWYGHVGRLRAAMQLCERVTVTTPALADQVTSVLGKPVQVVPNFLNELQLAVSADVYEAKVGRGFAPEEPLHLGYFSGTPSHAKDFQVVMEALIHVLEREPRVRVRVAGFLDSAAPFSRRYGSRVDRQPFREFASLQKLIGSTEVNLVPLQANVFADCKSELKYYEAAIVGTVSVVSPTVTYGAVIDDGQNGLLAESHEWEDKLMGLIEDLLGDRTAYTRMALAAHDHAIENYAPERVVATIERAIGASE